MLIQITNLTDAALTVTVEGLPVQLAAGDSTYSSTLSVADRSAQLRGDLLAVAVPTSTVRLEGRTMVTVPEVILNPNVFPVAGKAPKAAFTRAKIIAPVTTPISTIVTPVSTPISTVASTLVNAPVATTLSSPSSLPVSATLSTSVSAPVASI